MATQLGERFPLYGFILLPETMQTVLPSSEELDPLTLEITTIEIMNVIYHPQKLPHALF